MEQNTIEAGGCLCGEFRYRLKPSSVISTHNCHCKDCQKSTGSGYATFFLLPEHELDIVSGTLSSYKSDAESGGWVVREFCPECGSPILSTCSALPGLKLIKAGSLDNSDWLELASSYWGVSANQWAPVNADCPVAEKNT